MCDKQCFKCSYKDCVNDALTDAERKQQDAYDKELAKERIPEERKKMRKGKALVMYDYEHSDKGKATTKRKYDKYNHSEKGKAARKRYTQTEKGKENERRKMQRKIASGKNAEYCRRYRERKKKKERESNDKSGL